MNLRLLVILTLAGGWCPVWSGDTLIDPPTSEVSLEDPQSVAGARPGDWKVTAFKLEERAMEAYQAGDWKSAAARYAQSQLAYAFSFQGFPVAGTLKGYLLKETSLAREFIELLSPYDDHRDVYGLLDKLFQHDQERFQAYPRLAMAIALVYDQRPPRRWPHNQVSTAALPRRLPDPREAFDFWTGSDERGKTLFPLSRLMIGELKYVVDVAAPLEELRWAQDALQITCPTLYKLYWDVPYDDERYANDQSKWLDDDYRLPVILERGGICSDRAYYMTQVAKAHGVPCITVTGMAEDGLHAWAGYMEAPGKWNFQAGRGPEAAYITGRAFDPQTWRRPLDHELAFMKERLATEPQYRLSRLHSSFAILAAREGDDARALAAAKEAVLQDKRNIDAWEMLIRVTENAGEENPDLEHLCRNGAKAFGRYPDLEARFLQHLARLYDRRDQAEDARRVRHEIVRRNRRDRPDLALIEAAVEMETAMEEASMDEQVDLYKRQVTRFRRAGLIAGHRLVVPFVRHLSRRGEMDLARAAIAYARSHLEVSIPEQLNRMLADLERKTGL